MAIYKKIMVAVDFSSVSEKLIAKALEMSSLINAEIVIAHIVDYTPPSYVTVEIPEIYASSDIMKERAEENIKSIVKKITDTEIPVIVRVGHRKKGLIDVAEEVGADLAIFGKHDPSGLDRILGSTTHGVVNNAKFDMLVIHG